MCIGGMGGAPKMPSYTPPPNLGAPQNTAQIEAEAAAAAAVEREKQRLASGRAATILTSGAGVADTGPTSVATLLG